jgi:hypothetical protein
MLGHLRYIKYKCISGLPKFYNRAKKLKRRAFLRQLSDVFKWVFCILEIYLEKLDGGPPFLFSS